MDNLFAPRVLSPPCARNRAWMRSATDATTTLIAGPSSIADSPVPHGCEQVPTVGIGTGMQDMMKTAAAINPTRGLNERSEPERFLSLCMPSARKGADTAYHSAHQLKGSIPSEMCIAWASVATSIWRTHKEAKAHIM